MLSIFYGILSAGTWGAADFIGGLASKRTSPYRVLFLAEIAGLVPFIAIALLLREAVPPWLTCCWARSPAWSVSRAYYFCTAPWPMDR